MISLFTTFLKKHWIATFALSTSLMIPTTSSFACHRGGARGFRTAAYIATSGYGSGYGGYHRNNAVTPVYSTPVTTATTPIVQPVSMAQPVIADNAIAAAPNDLPIGLPSPAPVPGVPNFPQGGPNPPTGTANLPPGVPNSSPDAANIPAEVKEILPLIQTLTRSLKERNFAAAIAVADQVLQKTPQNGEVHQMKSLALFGRGDFKQAAAEAYSAMMIGRPMDWQTLQQLYPSTEEYTQQYQYLANATKLSNDAHLHFLLAYHYLILGHVDEARAELFVVKNALPQDRLVPFVLSQLTPPANEQSAQQTTPPNPFGSTAPMGTPNLPLGAQNFPNNLPNLPNVAPQVPQVPNNNFPQGAFLPPPAPVK